MNKDEIWESVKRSFVEKVNKLKTPDYAGLRLAMLAAARENNLEVTEEGTIVSEPEGYRVNNWSFKYVSN